LRQDLEQVTLRIADAEENMNRVEMGFIDVEEEPISKVIYPTKAEESKADNVWEEYKAIYYPEQNLLCLEAKRFEVRSVNWLSPDAVELHFGGSKAAVFATPLESVPEDDQDDEVTIGDTVILAGQYLIVVEKFDEDTVDVQTDTAERAVNFLKLTSICSERRRKRGMNRSTNDNLLVMTYLC